MDVLRSSVGKCRMDKIWNKENNGSTREAEHHRYFRKKDYSGMAMSKECQSKDYLNLLWNGSQ